MEQAIRRIAIGYSEVFVYRRSVDVDESARSRNLFYVLPCHDRWTPRVKGAECTLLLILYDVQALCFLDGWVKYACMRFVPCRCIRI